MTASFFIQIQFLLVLTTIYIYIYIYILLLLLLLLATAVEGNSKAPFSIATTAKCREERYSFLWIASLYS